MREATKWPDNERERSGREHAIRMLAAEFYDAVTPQETGAGARSSPMRIYDVYFELVKECAALQSCAKDPEEGLQWMAITECARIRNGNGRSCYGINQIFESERVRAIRMGKTALCGACVGELGKRSFRRKY